MKKLDRRAVAMLLAVMMLIVSFSACQDPGNDKKPPSGTGPAETGDFDPYHDDIPELLLDGEFHMLTFEEVHADMIHTFDEMPSDTLDKAKYLLIDNVESRFGIDIIETVQSEEYVNTTYRGMIATGADDFDLVFAYDRFAHYFAEENLIYTYDDLYYINLDKEYWDQSLLNYTTVGKDVYYAYGTYDFTYYDLTHCLIFNKDLMAELNISENPYDLVNSGKWTMDKMYEMAAVATLDNGDDVWTYNDRYGLVSSGKQILPNFWIAGGTTTVSLDRQNMPYLTMGDNEHLLNIIEKCFEMFYDGGVWYVSTGMGNQSDRHTEMFNANRALFADYTFFYIRQLRDCQSDYGVLPYPKYNEEQKDYFSRVEAGTIMATVPITVSDPTRSGAVIEAMASDGYETVRPKYYDYVLKSRDIRDPESEAMLDRIFATRVYDLGDTWYCDQIRDGIMATMWNTKNPNFASLYRSYEKMIKRTLQETIKAYLK